MRAAVIVFPGSNCDRDMAVALKAAGADVTMVWHKAADLPGGVDLVDRIAFTYQDNPNGSLADIAGVLSENRRVLGMMPHPERAVDAGHGGVDGKPLFAGLLGQMTAA